MGGLGSGNWYRFDKKSTVEECVTLDVGRLKRQGALSPGASGTLAWRYHNGVKRASIDYSVEFIDGLEREFQVSYPWKDTEYLDYAIRLEATQPHLGGLRWWFICPLISRNVRCERRVTKLYLCGRYFGCRHCHDLTYESCQEAHQEERLFKRLGRR